jgi:threonine dehydrogenase-like Zn-dependent dehydrogenase
MKVRGAHLVAPGRMKLFDRELGRLRDEYVRIRMTQVALCGSDTDRARTPDPLLETDETGHESAGTVIEIGEGVSGLRLGGTVVPWTRDGRQLVEFYDAPARYCTPIDPDVEFPSASEPLGCVVNASQFLRAGDDVAIVGGSGFLGRMAIQLCDLGGARLIVATSRTPEGRASALEAGATHAVDPDELETTVEELTGGVGVDMACEFVGHEIGIKLAGRVARAGRFDRKGGVVVVGGYHQRATPPTEWELLNEKAVTTFNAHFRADWECIRGMQRAARLLECGYIDPGPFTPFPLDAADDALRHAAETGEKSVVVF